MSIGFNNTVVTRNLSKSNFSEVRGMEINSRVDWETNVT